MVFVMHHSAEPGVCLQHPNYGLVSLTNANDLMLKMDDYVGQPSDLDRTLGRMAQVCCKMSTASRVKPACSGDSDNPVRGSKNTVSAKARTALPSR